jgi:hypothetical protein
MFWSTWMERDRTGGLGEDVDGWIDRQADRDTELRHPHRGDPPSLLLTSPSLTEWGQGGRSFCFLKPVLFTAFFEELCFFGL